jgi:hypothetical protein
MTKNGVEGQQPTVSVKTEISDTFSDTLDSKKRGRSSHF